MAKIQRSKTYLFLLGAFLLFSVIAVAGSIWFIKNTSDSIEKQQQVLDPLNFFLFKRPRTLSTITLNSLSGEQKPFTQHGSGWRLINFGYMYCPDICPINLSLLNSVMLKWEQQEKAPELQVVHVTFDPKRDLPDVLQKYLHYMNPSFYGLTGQLDEIRRLAQELNVVFIHEKPDETGNYFITHSDSMALINPQGDYVGMFKGPYKQADMLKALNILIN